MKRRLLITLALLAAAFDALPTVSHAQDTVAKRGPEAGRIYHIGEDGVRPPKALYTPQPEYDDAARKTKLSGTVLLSILVTKEGLTRDVKVVRSLSPGLDKKSIQAVSQWTFRPATKDGEPVAVQLDVETSFRIR